MQVVPRLAVPAGDDRLLPTRGARRRRSRPPRSLFLSPHPQDLLTALQRRLLATARPAIAAAAAADWTGRSFTLSPKDYDAAAREPVVLPSVASLECRELTTDGARAAVHREVCGTYCRQVEAVLRGGRFTECGGLWLKKTVRVLGEELVRVLGDEVYGLLELRRLQVFAVLVSLPVDVLDVSSVSGVCQSAQVELSEEEVQAILSLRVADVQCSVFSQQAREKYIKQSHPRVSSRPLNPSTWWS